MAVPFRRTSKMRKNTRRSHHHLDKQTIIVCPNCKAQIKPHRICMECGSYKSTNYIKPKEV